MNYFLLFPLLFLALVGSTTSSPVKNKVAIYELTRGEFVVKVTNWGATIVSVILPDSKGKLDDIVLGYDGIGPYINDTTYFGALIGRVANRIANATFTLNDKKYHLYRNDDNNSLHGFPGDVDVFVTYKIDYDFTLNVLMRAVPRTKPTPINLAQHSYWNLAGSGNVLRHRIRLLANHITPVDADLIPTGVIAPVSGTVFDFRDTAELGPRIRRLPGGFDINYVLSGEADGQGVRLAAAVLDSRSGRVLELWTDQPGLQFYTGNFLKAETGKAGRVYGIHAGLCLESQGFPDAVNHPNFPSQIYEPGQVYKHYMLFKFSFIK
ncbi:hypothetical protein ZIOFF_059747 [Zingiber officinale]|uniref:Aldose 1-epimerase n=1 Tax=Zingiber officinale TaxID=94328 RepID=A0A8J5KKK3_ZINOF|nr:hypothetical protein ZIOFF_059747 [Zingiber officinale]